MPPLALVLLLTLPGAKACSPGPEACSPRPMHSPSFPTAGLMGGEAKVKQMAAPVPELSRQKCIPPVWGGVADSQVLKQKCLGNVRACVMGENHLVKTMSLRLWKLSSCGTWPEILGAGEVSFTPNILKRHRALNCGDGLFHLWAACGLPHALVVITSFCPGR